MSKTVEDLMMVYDAAIFGGLRTAENHRVGVAAIVRALRDEFGSIMYPGDDWNRQGILEQFDQILGDAGADAARKAYWDKHYGVDEPTASATDPAPDVCTSCYGTGEDTVMERRCHCQPPDTTTTRCPDCNGEGCTPQTGRRGNVYAEPCQRCETTGRVPATDPAPAVCEWELRDYCWRTSCGRRPVNTPPAGYPNCACGLPIKFTEAK